MIRSLTAAAVAALTLVAAPAMSQDFRALAQQDLQRMHDELAANHPAPVVGGQAATTFNGWVDAGLAQAQAQVGRVNSGDSHSYLLRYYANGFRDSNITATPTFEGFGPVFATSWAGVATGWRNGQYVVTWVKPGIRNAPRVGSVVTECNLQPIEEYAKAKLDLWEGDLTSEAGRTNTAPYLLWNRNNPFASGLPSTCKFQQGRGRPRDVELRPIPVEQADLEAAWRASVFTPAQPLGVETVNGRPWINVHSFNQNAGWTDFLAQIDGVVSQLQGPQGFVIDLRGASGGAVQDSTLLGLRMANRIWTPEFIGTKLSAPGEITYRASAGNRTYFAELLGRMQGDPRFVAEAPQVVAQTQALVASFDQAIAANQPTFTVPASASTGAAAAAVANPVQGPVIVLVDGGCSGGCLYLVDSLTALPNVRVAGWPTATDSIFIEPTLLRLPSNYADLSYGHKAWTGRPRANNQPITPAQGLAYTGDPLDEAAVRTWTGTLFGV